MIEIGIQILLEDLQYDNLLSLLEQDLGNPESLDRFTIRNGRRYLAAGPKMTTHIFSGNIPGLPAVNFITSLLVKSAVLGKPASGEFVFPVLFAHSLREADSQIGNSVAVVYWEGGRSDIEDLLYHRSDLVTISGSDESVSAVRSRVRGRFLGFGHKLSLGVIAREECADETLPGKAAYDTAMFDQLGCLSPHTFYVEQGGEKTPHEFASEVAQELEKIEQSLPRGEIPLGASASINQIRGAYQFRKLTGENVDCWCSSAGTKWSVLYDGNPAFRPSCLYRTIRIQPVRDLRDLPALIEPVAHHIQSIGVAIPSSRQHPLIEQLARAGISRICHIGRMQHPASGWHNQGRMPIGDMIRWIDLEL